MLNFTNGTWLLTKIYLFKLTKLRYILLASVFLSQFCKVFTDKPRHNCLYLTYQLIMFLDSFTTGVLFSSKVNEFKHFVHKSHNTVRYLKFIIVYMADTCTKANWGQLREIYDMIIIYVNFTWGVSIETLGPYSCYCHCNHRSIEKLAGHDLVKEHSHMLHIPWK